MNCIPYYRLFTSHCHCSPCNLPSLPCLCGGGCMASMPIWGFTKEARAGDGRRRRKGEGEASTLPRSRCSDRASAGLGLAGWPLGPPWSLQCGLSQLHPCSRRVAESRSSFHPAQPPVSVLISGRESPSPSFEAAASTARLFSPSRRHFCSQCCLLLAPSALAWSSC